MEYWKVARLLIRLLLLSAAACGIAAQSATPPPLDITWYISPNGSSDNSTCGRTRETPCDSLRTILDRSPLFVTSSSGARCYSSSGNDDGRRSTTVYFEEGVNFVPPTCLKNWTNLAIIGLGNVTITSRLGAPRAFFEFDGCSNVTVRNLQFAAAFTGKGTFYFETSRQISIEDCSMPLIRHPSMGIEIILGGGDIEITNTLFYGNPSFATLAGGSTVALKVTQGRSSSSCSFQEECDNAVLEAINLMITNCTFQDIASGGTPSDSYSGSHTDALAVAVRFFSEASGNRMVVRDSLFTRIIYPVASSVLVNYDLGSVNNYALFVNCTFRDNRVRYGGGIAAYFYSEPQNGLLEVENCQFTDNEVSFEGGGVFAAFLSRSLENSVRISRSQFIGNRAQYGAGIFLFNNPAWFSLHSAPDAVSLPLIFTSITDCLFEGNSALLSEGVINTLRMQLNISGTNVFVQNSGSAIVLRSTLVNIDGDVVFDRNVAFTGGALNILDGSKVIMSESTRANFTLNKATFAGGAIFADDASSSISANEYNHTLAQGRFGQCFLMFGNEFNINSVRRRFIFSDNTAVVEGQNIFAFNLRGCIISNFVPNDTAQFLSLRGDGTVVYQNANPLESASTGPNYLYFYGASTKCYKPVGSVTYLLPNCSHELLHDTFYTHPDLECALRTFNSELRLYYPPGTGLRPTLDKLIAPWAGIETSWTQEPESLRLLCNETNPGNLFLSPAPGEQFDLTVQLVDLLLGYVTSTIYLEIEHEVDEPPGVLIQLNGIQYAYNDRVYFTPNRALSGLALVGLPGTEGRLHIVVDSQIRGSKVKLLVPFKLAQCPLGYFKPPTVSTIEEVNQLIVSQFSSTQRIPVDQPLACQCFSSENATIHFSSRVLELPHSCVAGYTVSLNSILWAGQVPVSDSESDATPPPATIPCPVLSVNATPIQDSLTEWVMQNREANALYSQTRNGTGTSFFNPVDVVPYEGGIVPGGGAPVKCYQGNNVSELVDYMPPGEFSIEFCTRGYCRGNPLSSWNLADVDYPCRENREGPLCGQCKPGYAVTLYSTVCQDCSHSLTFLPILLTLILGLLLVVIVLFLNLGASPTFDSLLFFIQAIMILLSSRTDYEAFQYLSFFNPDFTFNLCITSSLDGLTRLALQYVTPAYILSLLGLVLLIARIKYISKYVGKRSFLQALWLLFLITYINIANTTFELLHCKYIGPENGVHQFVLVHDASVVCYQGVHLPFAIIAILLAVFFVLPFPWYSLILMCFPKLKPITDVYCSLYKDHWRSWVWWSLMRRILLVLLGVFVQDFVYRHFSLLLAFAFILAVFELTWPYQTQFDNYFGCFISWMTLIVGIVTLPSIYLYVDPVRVVSALLVISTILLGFCLLLLETYLRLFRSTTISKAFKETMWPKLKSIKEYTVSKFRNMRGRSGAQELVESTSSSIVPRSSTVDATAYREPLLDSYFGVDGSINSISLERGSKRKTKTSLKRQRPMSPFDDSRSRPTTSIISPDRTSGYSDSGFATTYKCD